MNRLIGKIDIINYALIYWCFILNRSILERVYSDEITVVTGGLCIFLILLYGHKLKIYESEIISFVLLNLFLSILMLKTGLGYNYTSFININVFFVYTYLTLKIIGDKKKLYVYVINVAVVLSVISLVCFVIEQLGLTQLYNWVPEFMTGSTYARTKGGLLYAFNYQHPSRNCGIYGEPGMYQVSLSVALFFQLFLIGVKNKKDTVKTIILIVTQVTALSTIGFLCLSVILGCYLVKIRKVKILVVFLLLLVIVNIIPGPIKMYFSDKLQISEGEFENASARTRWADTMTDISLLEDDSILFGIGYAEYSRRYIESPIEHRQDTTSSNCLTKTLVIYGSVILLFVLFLYFYNIYVRSSSLIEFITCVSFFILCIVSQEVIFKPLMLFLLMKHEDSMEYGLVTNPIEKVIKYENSYL